MKTYAIIFGLVFLVGCGANFFSGKTIATYTVTTTTKDGVTVTKEIVYNSNKEQQGLSMDLDEDDGKVKTLKLHVDKASTQEQVIAASLALQQRMVQVLETLAPLVSAAAKGAGS